MGRVKEEILKLRLDGKSYSEIQKILNCSKGTISYHCGKGQKEKTYQRWKINSKKIINILKKRIMTFQKRDVNNKWKKIDIDEKFNIDQFFEKFNTTKCGLSGEIIDINDSHLYDLDHIIPKSKGGNNTLDNCQIVLRSLNKMKVDFTVDELVDNCKKVLIHKGYKIT